MPTKKRKTINPKKPSMSKKQIIQLKMGRRHEQTFPKKINR